MGGGKRRGRGESRGLPAKECGGRGDGGVAREKWGNTGEGDWEGSGFGWNGYWKQYSKDLCCIR